MQLSKLLKESVWLAKQRYVLTNQIDENTFNELIPLDPTPAKKYLETMTKWYIDGNSKEEIKKYVDNFYRLCNKNIITQKDIRRYQTFELFKNTIEDGNLADIKKNQSLALHKDAKLIYQDDRFTIVLPLTHTASKHCGKGAKWCTATTTNVHWNRYMRALARLYYITDHTKLPDDPFYKVGIVIYPDKTEVFDRYNKIWNEREYFEKSELPSEAKSKLVYVPFAEQELEYNLRNFSNLEYLQNEGYTYVCRGTDRIWQNLFYVCIQTNDDEIINQLKPFLQTVLFNTPKRIGEYWRDFSKYILDPTNEDWYDTVTNESKQLASNILLKVKEIKSIDPIRYTKFIRSFRIAFNSNEYLKNLFIRAKLSYTASIIQHKAKESIIAILQYPYAQTDFREIPTDDGSNQIIINHIGESVVGKATEYRVRNRIFKQTSFTVILKKMVKNGITNIFDYVPNEAYNSIFSYFIQYPNLINEDIIAAYNVLLQDDLVKFQTNFLGDI